RTQFLSRQPLVDSQDAAAALNQHRRRRMRQDFREDQHALQLLAGPQASVGVKIKPSRADVARLRQGSIYARVSNSYENFQRQTRQLASFLMIQTASPNVFIGAAITS